MAEKRRGILRGAHRLDQLAGALLVFQLRRPRLEALLTARARRYAATGSPVAAGGSGIGETRSFGAAAAVRLTVWPAKVFFAHSWLARSGSMLPSGSVVMRLLAMAF